MIKDSFYFPHDYHSRHDPKLSALIGKYGMEGYGIWWNIVEILHENGGKIDKFPGLIKGLACQFKQNEANLESIIKDMILEFCLLKENESSIWSDRVLLNFEKRKLKSAQRAEAGRVGGIKSGEKRSKTKQVLQANEANEAKERKGKEIKGKEIKKKSVAFTPPTLSEVQEYCLERGNKIDPQHFIDKNTAIGWVVGKNKTPIKDWKAVIRTWENYDNKPIDLLTETQKRNVARFQNFERKQDLKNATIDV